MKKFEAPSERPGRQWIWHVGFNKAGSTSLQVEFFPALARAQSSSVSFVGRGDPQLDDFTRRFHSTSWHPKALTGLTLSAQALTRSVQDMSRGTVIPSHENLLRPNLIGRTLRRLKEYFPASSVLIVYRPISELLASWLWHRGYGVGAFPAPRSRDILWRKGCAAPYPHSRLCGCHYGQPPLYSTYWSLSRILAYAEDIELPALAVNLGVFTGRIPISADMKEAWAEILKLPPPEVLLESRSSSARENRDEYRAFSLEVSRHYSELIERLSDELSHDLMAAPSRERT